MKAWPKSKLCNLKQISGMMSIIESSTYYLYNKST